MPRVFMMEGPSSRMEWAPVSSYFLLVLRAARIRCLLVLDALNKLIAIGFHGVFF